MNFYKRFMADYARKTARLTLAQHGAYTLLLDELYTTESPLPAELDELYRVCRAMTAAEREAVRLVAEQFFPVASDGLRHNPRATQELADAKLAMTDARQFWASLPGSVRSTMAARRRAAELHAVPAWLSSEDHEAIAAIYLECRRLTDETGVKHEVDHIVPLQGSNVRGLHVPWNLRAIPAAANRAKGRSHG